MPQVRTTMISTVGAVIVASGEGLRMGGVDKIFAPLLGWPLVAHSVVAFSASDRVHKIVLVVSSGNLDSGRSLVKERDWSKVSDVCVGGKRRQDSVRAGLERLSDVEWVVVHDGARPLVDVDMIGRGLDVAQKTGSAVAAVPVSDTIKTADEDRFVTRTLPRSELWATQTPQVFRRSVLAEAHDRVTEDVTDDAAMVEKLGGAVKIFTGSHENIKVTTTEDLAIAEMLLMSRHGGNWE